ncbi:uncharacterized protein [Dysidea avara]|uniref:uncharacterized protein isoform X2 n=1 Tax=Dysidea avara TaxID=196820 RepID=UPI003327AD03
MMSADSTNTLTLLKSNAHQWRTTFRRYCISQENTGYKLISKLGWCRGRGLGRKEQGDLDPIPFRPKDDHMGIGRWQFELENAQDATEKRRQLEIEKQITPELAEKYKAHADREEKMAEVITEMRKSFYCELCDKQYTNYMEYDNHLNSYSHAHNQRLKQLKQYEAGRRFGGRKDKESEQEKQRAQRIVARERVLMNMKRQVAFSSGGMLSAFKPVGDDQQAITQSNPQSTDSVPQSTTTSTPTLYYPVITSTANQPWEPTVLIKSQPQPPPPPAMTPPPKKKATVKPKKEKKKQVDHSGFVPRKIAKTSSTVKNPFLVTPPLPAEKKEENKAPDDLFSLYDDFDVAPAAASPINNTPSGTSIWDSFEATVVQQQPQQPPPEESDVDSEASSDANSEEVEEPEVTTPTPDHVSTTNNIPVPIEEVKEIGGRDSIKKTVETTHHPVEQKTESRNERLLRLLGMPMKSFLSAGQQCPLKDHTVLKDSNTGSYLHNPRPEDHDDMTDETTPPMLQKKQPLLKSSDDTTSHSSSSTTTCTVRHDIKRPDGLSFGLSKRGQLRRLSGHLFDREDSPVENDAIFVGAKGIRDIKSAK